MEFLFFTANISRQKKASPNTTWLAKKNEACLHERGNFFSPTPGLCQRRQRDAGAHRELSVFSQRWHVYISVGEKQKNCDRTKRQAVWNFFLPDFISDCLFLCSSRFSFSAREGLVAIRGFFLCNALNTSSLMRWIASSLFCTWLR